MPVPLIQHAVAGAVPKSRYWCFGLLSLGTLAGDLISKWWIFDDLGYPYRSSEVFASFPLLWGHVTGRLTTSFNRGALFGLGQGYGWLFAALSLAAVVGILYWLFVRGEARSWWMTVTLAFILAGALGNLYDRLYLHGCVDQNGKPLDGVRDFLDFTIPMIRMDWPLKFRLDPQYAYPIFNFADTYLVTGAIMLTVYSLFMPQKRAAKHATPATNVKANESASANVNSSASAASHIKSNESAVAKANASETAEKAAKTTGAAVGKVNASESAAATANAALSAATSPRITASAPLEHATSA